MNTCFNPARSYVTPEVTFHRVLVRQLRHHVGTGNVVTSQLRVSFLHYSFIN